MSEVKKLLEFLFDFKTETVKEFVVSEKFLEGKTMDGVSIAWLSPNFKKNHFGKIEQNVKKAELKVHRLLTIARDLPKDDEPGIIPELCGKQETTHAHFFQLLAHKQRMKNYTWLVGYIADENDVLCAVDACWDSGSGGWDVASHSVEDPGEWDAGSQVVSHRFSSSKTF